MNMKNNIIIGIDTSCYTTSIAAINFDKKVILNEKIMLKVKNGEKGLRQSDAIFQHLDNLGRMNESINKIAKYHNVVCLCASVKPRPVKDSYMPVFNVGFNFAKMCATLFNVKFFETTHQENHLEAILLNLDNLQDKEFMAVHMSGGTTEILKVVKNCEMKSQNCSVEIIGGTKDVSFGQLIDRLGIKLGYDFPCGKYIDENSLKCNISIEKGIKTSVKDGYMNLSGIENQLDSFLQKGSVDVVKKEYLSKLLLDSIYRSLFKSLIYLSNKNSINDVIFIGGVSSSAYLRNKLTKGLLKYNIRAYFSYSEYSTDNAVGCAIIGLNNFLGEK